MMTPPVNTPPAGRMVCFGELLVRLSSPHGELLLQSPALQACIGGAEANVAVSLAHFGHDVAMVGALPDNQLGHVARNQLRAYGVDTRAIACRPGRMGLYFLTPGAVLRPADIIYDRAGSAFALAGPGAYDWNALLHGADWLHVSGVSPALGEHAAQAVLDAVRSARRLGVRVSYDGNYRATLWQQQGTDGADILFELMGNVDLAFADQRDIALILKRPELADPARRDEAIDAAFAVFPQLARLAATVRTQHTVDEHELAAVLHTRDGRVDAASYRLAGIVDRIGTGDAFAAGVLHGLQSGWDDQRALDFGLAAGAIKHSIAGDFNLASAAQVEAAASGKLDVRR
jgi:2-dehydro-3-deoxygluconokinase